MNENNENSNLQNSLDDSNDFENNITTQSDEPAIDTLNKSAASVEFVDSVNSEYENKKSNKRKRGFLFEIWQWTQAILIAIIIAYLINAFVFERAYVDGSSMNPTLANGESLFEYKLGYFFNPPQRGDIVIFEVEPGKYKKYIPIPDPDEKDYIKRVIGLPGETINLKDGYVYVDGKKINEPYIIKGNNEFVKTEPDPSISFPLKVPVGSVFVLGDNRGESRDSRVLGPIKISKIRGKAVSVLVPFKNFRILKSNNWTFES